MMRRHSYGLRMAFRLIKPRSVFQHSLHYLSPSLRQAQCLVQLSLPRCRRLPRTSRPSFLTLTTTDGPSMEPDAESIPLDLLPVCCPGCGAYAQIFDPNKPGYYSRSRKKARKLWDKTKKAIEGRNKAPENTNLGNLRKYPETDEQQVISLPGHDVLIESPVTAPQYVEASAPPAQVCDRCHNLIHHSEGVSAPSPTIDSISAFLDESPHTRNRIYHVIDAADFPMSIIPGIYKALSVQRQRSKNRRAKTVKYKYGKRMTTISFVVTRSDLLAATKEQVDSKMQYIRNILLSTLRIKSEDVRLGNVHMISAHRGWWTKSVKGNIREHGGGIWVVGKANVGKSSFIQTCFPKSSKDLGKIEELLNKRQTGFSPLREVDASILNSDNLLPPAPREELFPTLPIVSPLPGTTVSPIRIPFGRGKGEVIDLPGLYRETLQSFVKDEHKADLIMTTRVSPKRLTIKPGQSLLLGGGLIRITPVDSMNVILAACFLPLETHVTKTEKAIEVQTQNRAYVGKNITRDGTGDILSSAGVFELNFDVTQNHLPAVVKKILDDKSIPSPYRVMSMDLLIEGCGWIELTAQIRARENPETSTMLPKVEVFSPHGKYIGSRPPMESWAFIAQKRESDKRKNGSDRPMRQNISQKKRELHSSKL